MQLYKITFIIILQRPITVLDSLHSSFPACAVSWFRVSSKGWHVRIAKLPNISNKWSDLTWVRATQKQAQLRTPGLAASWIWTAFVWITACFSYLTGKKKMKIGLTLNIYVYISNFSHWSKKRNATPSFSTSQNQSLICTERPIPSVCFPRKYGIQGIRQCAVAHCQLL